MTMPDDYEENCRPDGPGSDRSDILWEGDLINTGRRSYTVKARIVVCEGAFIDEHMRIGPGMKLQTWDAGDKEWRKASPYAFNAASLVVALAATNPPLPK